MCVILLIRTANTEVSICLYMLLTNIYEMTCGLVNTINYNIDNKDHEVPTCSLCGPIFKNRKKSDDFYYLYFIMYLPGFGIRNPIALLQTL